MKRYKIRVIKVLALCVLLLFLYTTRSLIQTADKQLTFATGREIPGLKHGNSPREGASDNNINSHSGMDSVGKSVNNEQHVPVRRYMNGTEIQHKKQGHISTLGDRYQKGVGVGDGQKDVHTAVRDSKKDVHSGKALEQPGQQTQNTQSVEYYVEEYGGEDRNVTYPPFVEHSPENGPGEWGNSNTYKPTRDEVLQWQEGEKRNSFNQLVSDQISVHRRLPDSRLDECKSRVYPADLPPASVIICFHNEAWSTLLRSVHSVLDRSPAHLIREIILVDDASTQDHLMAPLTKYMSKLGKVKIVRHRKQQGLIRARLTGYEVAAGPVLVFLDSHIECFPGWLEPLLDRIRKDPRNVPFPKIDMIHPGNFGTGIGTTIRQFGVFDWKMLFFNWGNISKERKGRLKTPADPIRSPTMPGGLFAIDKQWFTTLGTYDPGLLYWGGENMELSFKVWMCNGSLELLPCSHVGHVFRYTNPVKWKGGGDPILANSMRVAEVWLDEYKYLFYEQTSLLQGVNFGEVNDRKKLRESLHCHNFRWYIENVFPECVIVPALNAGEIRSVSSPTLCLDAGTNAPSLYPCHGAGGNQYWQLLPSGIMWHSNTHSLCVKEGELTYAQCWGNMAGNWTYTEEKSLQLGTTDTCLTLGANTTLVMGPCNRDANQRWIFEKSKFKQHKT
ncbi:polypeptide N-acetylgalactosaminyltransferase 5-like isoform X1 [Haliotis rufescens]|uniref:polypeptide N-acetylgalactosaminyltransferase 5-like isoform X1 n=1 Tax=Haliotis rufescens TaxID=6454 RepID=UPI00201EBECA|nr:polypeptide N-acetylgalactosaminyltransferase 5-like isoform X1 [Haliotis rufescens]